MISNQNKIIIGSRSSPLAQKQVEIFLDSLAKIHGNEILSKIEKRYFKTAGDKLLHANFMDFGYKGLFTKEIDEALVKKEITFAVHSLKDLPTKLPRNLEIVAVLRREEVNDVIVSKNFQTLEEISSNSVVGTSSLRRYIQLKKFRKDLRIKEIRGNVDMRIKKVFDGEYDAVILAAAGLNRLGGLYPFKKINIKTIIPAAGQAAIGIVAHKNSNQNYLLKNINHPQTFEEVMCERNFLEALDGSCKTPIGANAKLKYNSKGKILFRYMVSSNDFKNFFKGIDYFDSNSCTSQSYDLGSVLKKKINE